MNKTITITAAALMLLVAVLCLTGTAPVVAGLIAIVAAALVIIPTLTRQR